MDENLYELEMSSVIKSIINLGRIEVAINTVGALVNGLLLNMNPEKREVIKKAYEEIAKYVIKTANKYNIPSMFLIIVIGLLFIDCGNATVNKDAEFIFDKLYELTGVKLSMETNINIDEE